ncbi:hypothetical protein P170DRAFT_427568 [Aspergillus steynii IBT 23096]|uniref:Transferase family protein n=1 Tax=Aspergillus steynii IBT 23096 TaxID=1392250 RepID=A0A2I2G6H8_9EURO|nr:uncharacterized protein P170DRAFT_427568 [Aspergillus steynii IBT 23096]PLB48484.1 hypothetical protein P170DRAFT_427568 [Aspergillus steynii IBT 23096]
MIYFEPYPLTELDHLLMPVYLHLFLTFKTSRIQESVEDLETGVSCLIQEWPFLAGSIAKPGPDQKAYQVQPPSEFELQANPMLRVKTHGVPVSVLQLAEETPEELISVKPHWPTLYPAPALRFQANIMANGIILSLSWHHRLMDAFGCQGVLDGLAQFCRLKGSTGDTLKTSPQLQEGARQRIRNFSGSTKDHAAFSDTYGYSDNQYQDNQAIRGYMLCPRKVETLRRICDEQITESGNASNIRLTCDDIVTAIIWLSASQARNRALSAPHSSLIRYVNVRKLLEPPIPTDLFGNAIAMSKSHCNLQDLRSEPKDQDSSEHVVPGLTRQAVNHLSHFSKLTRSEDTGKSVDASHVGDLLSTLRASSDWDSLTLTPVDVSVSSMRRIKLYNMDFGESFGLVKDVDTLESNLQGQYLIRPARNCSSDAPWEIKMALPKKVVPFLDADPVLTWASVNERPRL